MSTPPPTSSPPPEDNNDSRLPPSMEALHQSEQERLHRIARQKWQTSRIVILLLLDITFSATLYVTYKHSKSATDDQPVFFWILMMSVLRSGIVTVGGFVAISVGLPTAKAIAREMGQVGRRRHQRNDLVNESALGRDVEGDSNQFLFLLSRRKRPTTSSSSKSNPSESAPTTAASPTPGDLLTPLLKSEETQSSMHHKKDDSPTMDYKPPRIESNPAITDSENENSISASPSAQTLRRNSSEDSMIDTLGLFGTESAQKLEDETRYHRAVKRVESSCHVKRNFILVGVFLGLTLSNFVCCVWFVGVSTDLENIFGNETFLALPIHGWLVTGVIVVASAEFFAVQRLVFRATSDTGVLLRTVHPHKLYYDGNMSGHSCDNCNKRFRHSNREGYSCRICDFDCCLRCFKLRSMDRGEGILRSDKGPKTMSAYSMWSYLNRALQLSIPFLHWLFFSFILLVATQIVGLVLPTYQGKIIDDVFKQDPVTFKSDIYVYAVGSLLTSLLASISSVFVTIVQKNLECGIRVKLFQAVLSQDISFFDGMMTGQISSRIQSDTQELVSPCYTILNTGLSNLIMLIGALYMCLNTSWQLTILALCSIGPIVTISNSYARWARPIWLQVWQALGDSNSVALQAIMNIRSVKSFATEDNELNKYQSTLNIMLRKGLFNSFVSSISSFLSGVTELSVGVLVLAIGGTMVMEGSGALTVGKLIAFQLYWNKMDSAYSTLTGIFNTLIQTSAAAERVFSLMECKSDIEATPKLKEMNSWGREINHGGVDMGRQPTVELQKRIPADNVPWSIQISNVRFTYQMRPETEVLKGVDLEIPAGSVCAFVGRSGGGKSTLIHLLQRFYDPKAGFVSYGGVDLRDIDLKWYRSQTGVVAQDTQLFNISIKENICYGCPYPVTLASVVDAAKKACLHDFIVTLDEGYDTRAGERGTRLSGGQKQRVAIARALLRRPRLLLLDEATSALDSQSEKAVQKALDNLMVEMAGQCTIVLVAHRLSTVINSDRIFVVDGGRIAERGTHEELLAKQGIYESLVHQQLSKKDNEIPEDSVAESSPT